jgi:hypothetical protein
LIKSFGCHKVIDNEAIVNEEAKTRRNKLKSRRMVRALFRS